MMDAEDRDTARPGPIKRGAQRRDPLDTRIGKRIRHRRKALNLSQSRIAAFLGVTYQQIQKYETGRSRISAATLYRLAYQLAVPLGYFFEGDIPAE